jgi:hypothetical protein
MGIVVWPEKERWREVSVQAAEDRRQKTEDRRQKTELRNEQTEFRSEEVVSNFCFLTSVF